MEPYAARGPGHAGRRRAPASARALLRAVLRTPLWTAAALAAASVSPAARAAGPPDAEPIVATRAELAAAMVIKFASFVEWNEALGDTLQVAVANDPEVFEALKALAVRHGEDQATAGGAAPGLPAMILVRDVTRLGAAGPCHVLCLGDLGRRPTARLLEWARETGALSVATGEASTPGSVIRLFSEDNRLRFDVDQSSARASRLRISSLLLKLARQTTSRLALGEVSPPLARGPRRSAGRDVPREMRIEHAAG